MAITDKKTGVWGLDQTYNKINQGSIWDYSGMSGLWSWGYNSKGQQGQNSPTAYYSSPTQVGSDPFVHISNGFFEARYYLATTSGGKMYSWGWNNKGQLGQNDETGDGKSSPIQIGSDTTWNHGSHGSGSSVAVKTDGTLWSWGYNASGELGQNSQVQYSSPVQVGSATDWATAYGSHVFGLYNVHSIKTDGTLWAWGHNGNGKLGTNNLTQYSSPIQIPGTTWSKVVSSNTSVHAIKTDGTLWSWGYNGFGNLGTNNITQYSSPKQVGSDTTWAAVTQGAKSTYATKTDGTLWSWGYNGFGQLGQNSQSENVKYSSPVQIPGTTWTTSMELLNGEDRFVLVGKTDGTIWGWGSNIQGQLGQNSQTQYSSPVQVGSGSWGTTSISGNVYASAFTGQL